MTYRTGIKGEGCGVWLGSWVVWPDTVHLTNKFKCGLTKYNTHPSDYEYSTSEHITKRCNPGTIVNVSIYEQVFVFQSPAIMILRVLVYLIVSKIWDTG